MARIKRRKNDGYLVWAVAPGLDILIRQIKSQDPEAFVTGYLDYAQSLEQLEGARYVSEMYASPNFVEAFSRQFGEPPFSKGANAYDIVKLLVSAYEGFPQARPTAAELKRALIKVRSFPGAVGTFSIDSDGNSTYRPVIREIKGGERRIVGDRLPAKAAANS